MDNGFIEVEVVYALPRQQIIKSVQLSVGMTVKEAINLSGLTDAFPQLCKDPLNVGVFAKSCELDHVLNDGDRVEIYRPLIHDPKEARRLRAKK
jgi:putative ubiquitin-RnfH superfamily antitoxin RatB of RatAB toxin-antitoxin module